MAVVLYHFGIPGVGGGFAGVDIFFVISGFLMIGIILKGLEKKQFSIGQFYLARAKRIIPALLVLCLIEMVLGWFLLMPEEFQGLGLHARESLYFTSNLQYLGEAGYFDTASREKWLLHTWSLSVEWQFYMILPLLLLTLWQRKQLQRNIPLILTLLVVLSAGWCLWLTLNAPDKAFYTLQARAWEMLAGGLVFLASRRLSLSIGHTRLAEVIGFALIIGSITLLNKDDPWPGLLALIPVIGTMLVLLASRSASRWTNTAAAQWLGTRSYSLYLWHWPLVVGLTYTEKEQSSGWIIASLMLSILLGHTSYHLVETPARRWLSTMTPRQAAIVMISILIAALLLAQQVRRNGFSSRLPAQVAVLEAERHNGPPHWARCSTPQSACKFGDGPLRAILIGDSHGYAVITALASSIPDTGSVMFKGVARCPIIFGVKTRKKDCVALNESLAKPDALPAGIPVIMVGRTSKYVNDDKELPTPTSVPTFYFEAPHKSFSKEYVEEFQKNYVHTMCKIAERHPLWLLRPLPKMAVAVPTATGRALLLNKPLPHIAESLPDYRKRTLLVWQMQDEVVRQCDAQILDPLPLLCNKKECPGMSPEDRPYYRDDNHLSEFGNRRLVPMFSTIFTTP